MRTLREYAARVWANAGEDNVFFLAGGIAFNILLAAVPFVLLVVTGLTFFLNQSTEASITEVYGILDRFLPAAAQSREFVETLVADVIRTRGTVGLVSAIAFVWASTRLFSSLRSTLALVLDIENERGIVAGKLFDMWMTVVSTLLLVAYIFINAYIAIGTTRGVQVLLAVGLRADVMGSVEYWFGRLLAFAAVVAMLFGLLKYLPRRRIRSRSALIGAIVTGLLLEVAKVLFAALLPRLGVGGLYTGALAAIVIVVFWTYYAALMFLLGSEIAQIHALRHVRRQRRETFGAA